MDDDYAQFKKHIFKKTSIDLSLYKEKQMKRRLQSLCRKHGYATFQALFHKGLSKQEPLMEEFLDKMTINVSAFFRNPQQWDVLESKILPELLSMKKSFDLVGSLFDRRRTLYDCDDC